MFDEKGLIFPLPQNADTSYYCHVLQERGAYIKQLKAGTLSFKEAYATYPKLIRAKAPTTQLEGLAQIIAATENLTSAEQLKWIGKQPFYEDGQLVTMGTLQVNGNAQAMPTIPVEKGNVPQYDGTSQVTITDIVSDKALQFIAVKIDGKQLLVCDRNIVARISWDQLNNQNLIIGKEVTIDGQKYKLRVLTGGTKDGDICEWNKIMSVIDSNNTIWHWADMWSWCQETTLLSRTYRTLRGASSIAGWSNGSASNNYLDCGWRPVLEIL